MHSFFYHRFEAKVLLVFLSLLMSKCGEPEMRVPHYKPKIAVDAYIEAGRPPEMYLTYSSPFITDYDSVDFVNMVKFNVSAYVITEAADTIGFMRQTNSADFPPFKYTMSATDLVGEAGKSYRLLIRKSGEEDITASTRIPFASPEVLACSFVPYEACDTLGLYLLELLNREQEAYFFVQNKFYDETKFYPVRLPVKSNRFFSTSTLTYTLRYNDRANLWLSEEELENSDGKTDIGDSLGINVRASYHVEDTLVFKVSAVDALSFEVLSSLFLDAEFPDNPFKPISQLPVSNVSNGIGHWTGMNSVRLVVKGTAQKKPLIPAKESP